MFRRDRWRTCNSWLRRGARRDRLSLTWFEIYTALPSLLAYVTKPPSSLLTWLTQALSPLICCRWESRVLATKKFWSWIEIVSRGWTTHSFKSSPTTFTRRSKVGQGHKRFRDWHECFYMSELHVVYAHVQDLVLCLQISTRSWWRSCWPETTCTWNRMPCWSTLKTYAG